MNQNGLVAATRWISLSGLTRIALQFFQIIILARLLEKEDFALVAIAQTIIFFTISFSDIGLTSSYIQKKNINEVQRSSLFWITFIFGVLISLILIIISNPIQTFFDKDGVSELIFYGSFSILFISLGSQLKAHAEKKLKFKKIIVVEILSTVSGFLTTVFFALNGYGANSVIYGFLVSTGSNSLLLWIFARDGWFPIFSLKLNELTSFIEFGLKAILNDLLSKFGASLDILIGGKYLTATSLGEFSLPRNFVLQIQTGMNPFINRIGFPVLSKIQDDQLSLSKYYQRILKIISSLFSPICVLLFVYADNFIKIFFGEKWASSAEILSLLSIWILFRSFRNPIGSLKLSTNNGMRWLFWNIFTIFIVFGFINFFISYGSTGISIGLALSSTFLYIPLWYFLIKPTTNMKFISYVASTLKPLLIATVSLILEYLFQYFIGFNFVYSLFFFSIFYLILTKLFNREIFNYFVSFISIGKAS